MKKIQSIFLPALVAGVATIFTSGIASADNAFVSNNGGNSISEIASDGTVSTFVASTPDLAGPTGLAFDSAGNLFVANNGSGDIAEFSSAGVFLGNYSTGLQNPRGLAFDSAGNLFVANQSSGQIIEIPVGGGAGTVIATGMNFPNGMTFDSAGNLYVASGGGNFIDKITFSGSLVNTIAPFATGLSNPNGLAFAGSSIFEVDNGSNSIIQFNSAGTQVGSISDSNINNSKGLAIDSHGDFFVTDEGSNSVTEYGPGGNFLATFTGDFNGPNYITTLAVPEPSAYALLTLGLGFLIFFARRKTTAAV